MDDAAQLANFCLQKDEQGPIRLTQDHAYFQVQIQPFVTDRNIEILSSGPEETALQLLLNTWLQMLHFHKTIGVCRSLYLNTYHSKAAWKSLFQHQSKQQHLLIMDNGAIVMMVCPPYRLGIKQMEPCGVMAIK